MGTPKHWNEARQLTTEAENGNDISEKLNGTGMNAAVRTEIVGLMLSMNANDLKAGKTHTHLLAPHESASLDIFHAGRATDTDNREHVLNVTAQNDAWKGYVFNREGTKNVYSLPDITQAAVFEVMGRLDNPHFRLAQFDK